MEAWAASGDLRNAALAARGLAQVTFQLGRLTDTAEAYRRALLWATHLEDHPLESEISSRLGSVLALLADGHDGFDAARRHCNRGLELARSSGSERHMAGAVHCLGDVAYCQQEGEQAAGHYREAVRHLEAATGAEAMLGESVLSLGQALSDLGQFDEAHAALTRARGLWRQHGDSRQTAIVDVSLGRLFVRRGEYQRGLELFETARPRLEEAGDALWQGSAIAGIAEVLLELGNPDAASTHWARARDIFERAGLHHIAIDAVMAIGENDLAAGDPEAALSHFRAALQKAEALEIDRWKAYALRFIGLACLARSMPRQALEYLEQSLAIQQRLGASGGYRLEARLHHEIGETHRQLGNHILAEASLERALALSRVADDRVTQATAIYALARSADDRNDLRTALTHIADAIAVAESIRSDVLHRELRTSYVSSIFRWYELQVDILMRLHAEQPDGGYLQAAFEASERARARTLLDGIADRELDLRDGLSPDLLAREQQVLRELTEWAASQPTGTADPADRVRTYRELEFRYEHIQAEIRRASPAYNARTRASPRLRLRDVQRELLDERTWLVEYLLGETRSHAWVVSRTDVRAYELPAREQIERLAARVYQGLSHRPSAEEQRPLDEAARQLAKIILHPLAGLPDGQRVVVVADGALHHLPFGALPVPWIRDREHPLLAQYEIINLPSVTTFRAVERTALGDRRLAVIADPVFEADDPRLAATRVLTSPTDPFKALFSRFWSPVPRRIGASSGDRAAGAAQIPRLVSTRQEAEAILRLAPGTGHLRALDFDASRDALLGAQIGTFPVIHVASHSLFDNTNPAASGILLSRYDREGRPRDGFVRLADIYRLKLPVEMVVLSACSTALGEPVRGEGLVGVVRGFFHAGARRVVASHWRVDDEATAELMRRFYTELLQRGRAPSQALREAQLSLRRIEQWSAPYYWAAFALHGQW